MDIVTDVSILCLPLPMIWKLQMSTKNKRQVTSMFLVGSLYVFPEEFPEDLTDWYRVVVGGIVRTVYSSRISQVDETCRSHIILQEGDSTQLAYFIV